jgi:hypothetical protein
MTTWLYLLFIVPKGNSAATMLLFTVFAVTERNFFVFQNAID